MSSAKRPLSPHLQVYRPQLTSVLSIMHRLTGVGLSVGTLLLVYWLAAAAAGPDSFAAAQDFVGSFLGRLLLFGWTVSLFFHLCNGIRHLFWTRATASSWTRSIGRAGRWSRPPGS
jgi:succinate dehydrogenase / fumarate reductase cytochrome b subunit